MPYATCPRPGCGWEAFDSPFCPGDDMALPARLRGRITAAAHRVAHDAYDQAAAVTLQGLIAEALHHLHETRETTPR